jgi:nucleoid-associated protein YgaU
MAILTKEVIMLHITSKKITLPLCICVISVLFTPSIVLAASETGSVAASQAADQKAALAKKAADRQAKKAAETQIPAEEKKATETQIPAEEKKEKE